MTPSEVLAENYPRPKLIAIDPWQCGCNECMEGMYKPLREATDQDIGNLLNGTLRNHTGITLDVTAVLGAHVGTGENLRTVHVGHEVIVTCQYGSWTVDPHLLGFPIR
ncbi:hypothetical protein ACQP2T_61555 [Nonomuraea sp. CA-143628]|uniref:hypothetical protein n=1 Tax=Nonomuraea sp. CA-143628 TaxID=3239997 RepID=UPI003D9483FB